ncbi:MAG: hypothetical protein WDM96_09400 [Lacunisphaera sp.]
MLARGTHAEEFQHVADPRVALVLQLLLGVARESEVDRIRPAAGLADDVVAAVRAGRQFVEARAVVQVAAAHEAEILEGGEAAVDRHEVAGPDAHDLVQPLDADRTFLRQKRLDQRGRGAWSPHAGGADPVARFFQDILPGSFSHYRGEGMIRLGRCDHAFRDMGQIEAMAS